MFGTWKRPQEYLTNLMLSMEYNTVPILSWGISGIYRVFEGVAGIKLPGSIPIFVKKNLEPSLGMAPAVGLGWLATGVGARVLGLMTPAVGREIFNLFGGFIWPGFLTNLSAGTVLGVGVGLGATLTIGVANAVTKHFKDNFYKDVWDTDGAARVGSRLVGGLAGLGAGILGGGGMFLAPVAGWVPAIVAWWGVNYAFKTGLRAYNRALASRNLMKDSVWEVWWAANMGGKVSGL